MAIFRCNKCGHLREIPNNYIGESVHCPQCKTVNQIQDTVGFIEKVLEKYILHYKLILATIGYRVRFCS